MSDLMLYGKSDDILALANRLQQTIPGGRKLTKEEALSLSQLSVAHGLDPFNGEAWIIPGSGLMVGIKGLRKAARRMAESEGGVYWIDPRLVEPALYGQPKDAIVYEFRLRDTVTLGAWSKTINTLTSSGMPYKEAIEVVGPPPVVLGVGIATVDERSKMGIHQRARKRAEADAIKQRYSVDFAVFTEDDNVIEGELREPTNGSGKSELQILSELGFDSEPPQVEEKQGEESHTEEYEPTPPEVAESLLNSEHSTPANGKMSLESALEVQNSEGVRYGDIPRDKLEIMYRSLVKSIADPKFTGSDRETREFKRDAISVILAQPA